MYIVLVNFLVPVEKVNEQREGHLALLTAYYEKGKAVAWGRRKNPENGGVILCKNMTRAEVEEFTAKDPYVTEGLATHTILEASFGKVVPELKGLLD